MAGGVSVGLVAGYSRSSLDGVLMRATDVVLAFPSLVLILVLLTTVGSSWPVIVAAVAFTHIPRAARVTRGVTLGIVDLDYIRAAEAIGVAQWRILVSEILPNISSSLLVESGFRFAYALATVAALAFLGFGEPPPTPNWGTMISENRVGLAVQPFGVLAPAIAIGAVTIGAMLVADGLARALIGIERTVEDAA
jgi:peptide/nickel transport system permease protein